MLNVASFQASPRLAVYSATKAYVTSLTDALHEEMRGSGVRVTALCPGLTRTEFQSISSTEQYSRDFPSFSWLDVTDVARAGLRDVARGRALSVPVALRKELVIELIFYLNIGLEYLLDEQLFFDPRAKSLIAVG
jgi:short-subunit dehydrogenase